MGLVPDDHPELQLNVEDADDWVLTGEIVIRIFKNPLKPGEAMLRHANEGMDYFQQHGVLDTVLSEIEMVNLQCGCGDDDSR